jgi:hypothetical protein
VTWSASGGGIAADGLYSAGMTGGLSVVRTIADGQEASVEVRVRAERDADTEGDNDIGSGERVIRWRGNVPPQKWMNFYTKVLSRFASSPGLKPEVSLQVPVEGSQSQSKVEETRSGLNELGLDDGTPLT